MDDRRFGSEFIHFTSDNFVFSSFFTGGTIHFPKSSVQDYFKTINLNVFFKTNILHSPRYFHLNYEAHSAEIAYQKSSVGLFFDWKRLTYWDRADLINN